jgi:hypothetical protein
MTPPEADVMDSAVRDALFAHLPETRELSFDRIDTRATRRRHRILTRQIAAVVAIVLCAGVAVAHAHSGGKPKSLEVTNPNGSVTPITHERSRRRTAVTTAPAGIITTPGSSPSAPAPDNGRTPGSSPAQVAPPATNAPSGHTTTPATTPRTSPPHLGTTPTTVFQPTIPSNLPAPYDGITYSRVIVILTDSGYWTEDRTGLHEGTTAHILNRGYFDVVFLDERTATPNSAWLYLIFPRPGYQPASFTIHAWDGAPDNVSKRELIAFPYDVTDGTIQGLTSPSLENSNRIPGTAATLAIVHD